MENENVAQESTPAMSANQGFGDRLESEVKNLLDRIDNGNIFKSIIVLFFRLIGWGIIASGLWECIINMFSDDDSYRYGYFSKFENLEGMQQFTSVIGFLIGLVLCLATIYVLFLFVKKRTNQLEESPYEGLIHYMYKSVFPTMIMIFGEVLSLLLFLVGILTLVAAILSSLVYFPLADMLQLLGQMVDFDSGSDGIWIIGFNEYTAYFEFLKSGGLASLGIMAVSAFVLVGTYIFKEVYQYLIKLVIKLVEFAISKNGILILFIGIVLSYVVIGGFFSEILEDIF
ncbi:MAG: hypothetical protein HN427_04850 [Flavobacteriales bacterium]|jgi:hypothetical protein|nr:hypothetical protein [Flavobacteriales bacterium]